MLESFNSTQQFEYHKLTAEEQKQRGILGRLAGIIADGKKPTRNGRKYPISLWEKVFNDPIMIEKIENRVCLGELGHPEDRAETDITKAAICLAEVPKKGPDDKLFGVFDILDTPCGRILKTLCDYGCKIGVSSRGQGDVFSDYTGEEVVDEDTYNCECWDAVLIPAVKTARPALVNESLNGRTLKQTLTESLNSATPEARKVMEETLSNLELDYKDSSDDEEDVESTEEEAVNDGEDLVERLQQALKDNAELSKQVAQLQEKLSVSYAKEIKHEANTTKLKNTVIKLSEDVKTHKAVTTQLASMRQQLESKSTQFIEQKQMLEATKSKLRSVLAKKSSLTESIDVKDRRISDLTKELEKLNETLTSEKSKSEKTISSLTENLKELKTDSQAKHSQYVKKLSAANSLVEKYRKTAETAVNRYIESKATQLGVSVAEIKNRLEENYSFDDVDNVCESLRSYKMNMNKLPFNIRSGSISHVAMKENNDTKRFENPDDVLDESFLETINS